MADEYKSAVQVPIPGVQCIADILNWKPAGRPVLEAVIRAHQAEIRDEWQVLSSMAHLQESPIELYFAAGLIRTCRSSNLALLWRQPDGQIVPLVPAPGSSVTVVPQFEFKPYRLDFLLVYTPSRGTRFASRLDVECDGEAYHSSPEQRAKDNKRDAFMRRNDFKVIRFEGTQLYGAALECARAAVDKLLG